MNPTLLTPVILLEVLLALEQNAGADCIIDWDNATLRVLGPWETHPTKTLSGGRPLTSRKIIKEVRGAR